MAFHMPYSPLSSPVFSPPSNPFSNASPTTRRATRPPLSTVATTSQVPARPGVSMEDWDARCPLPEIATQSVEAIKERATRPVRVSQAYPASDGGSTRPGTPLGKGSPLLSSRSLGTMNNLRVATPVGRPHALHPTQPISTPQAFFDWLALVDRAATHSQESHFRAHLASLSEHLETCTSLLSLTSAVQSEVDAMLADWRSVEEGGRSLQDACARLLGEREELVRAEEEIAGRMEVFAELESATRMLNAPGESLVMRGDFLDMVERVDACIGFLREHRQYREAELYLLRFEQCLVRAMTLIRMYFVGSLRALNADVSKRLGEKDVSATATHHLLYTRFRSVAGPLSPLLGELERRAAQHTSSLGSLLDECHAAYFAARRALLVPRLQAELRGLDPTRAELVSLARSGCGLLREVCADEWELFGAFFKGKAGRAAMYTYLEGLCDHLYDDLRPRILHESRLSALGEVCAVLRALMVLDVPAAGSDDDDSDREDEELSMPDTEREKKDKGLGAPPVAALLAAVLQDAQTRLFFRAQAAIQTEIRGFVPKDSDLAYPAILLDKDRQDNSVPPREKDLGARVFAGAKLEKRETWYPTLGRAVWVLSQLGEFVQPAIFADLASEALALTRASLSPAAARLPPLDGALFRARHLLILKELARGLDLGLGAIPASSSSSSATAPPPLTRTVSTLLPPTHSYGATTPTNGEGGLALAEMFSGLLGRAGGMLPLGVQDSLGFARPGEGVDAKHAIDADLKLACEDVIALLAHPATAPLQSFLSSALSFPRPPPSAAQDASRACIDAISRDLRSGAARLRLYVPDNRTVGVLLGHVRDRVVEEYGAFVGVVGREEGVVGVEDVREGVRGACSEDEEGGAGGSGST